MIPGVAAAAASASIRISAAASRPQPRIGTPGGPRSPWCMGDRMYTLYWTVDSGALAVQAVLEELGQLYRREILVTAAGDHLRPDYLTLNPMVQVPSLRLPDGTLMTESAAMLVHLCDTHTEPPLLPPPGTGGRAHAYRWLFWLATGLYESDLRFYYPDRYTADPKGASGAGADGPAGRDRRRPAGPRPVRSERAVLGRRPLPVHARPVASGADRGARPPSQAVRAHASGTPTSCGRADLGPA